MSNKSGAPKALKPILLYDHLPGILAGYPCLLFSILAILSLFGPNQNPDAKQFFTINQHMLFWVGMAVMIVWYIAFRFNLPKKKFLLMFGLFGTFVGIPVALELTGVIKPFSWMATALGTLTPEVNTGAWIVMALVFFVIWLANLVWSRTHLRVRIDESGLTVNRLGGKGERFELIGLKTENEPLDYLELFMAGVGSLSLKTRMNKPIFKMNRVIGLYRTPWFPFFKSKLARIEEMLSYQGKVFSVDAQDRVDMAEQADADDYDHDESFASEESAGEEVQADGEGFADHEASEPSSAKEDNIT